MRKRPDLVLAPAQVQAQVQAQARVPVQAQVQAQAQALVQAQVLQDQIQDPGRNQSHISTSQEMQKQRKYQKINQRTDCIMS